jgi:hypothetical protein
MARSSTAAQLEKICRGYRRALNGLAGRLPCDDEDQRWVRDRSTESGMIRIEAQLLPEEAALVLKAIEAARERAWKARRASAESSAEADAAAGAGGAARRGMLHRADALVQIAEDLLASSTAEANVPPVEIVVHVEADCLTDPTSAETGTLDDGTTALRRALRLRDTGCRFPGCTNTRVDSHHVVPWSRGGGTKLANLVSTCRKHHRYVHELGFRIELRDDGTFAFFAPAGWEVKPVPDSPPLRREPVAALREQNASAGLAIDQETRLPRWDGTAADYHHIVHVLATKYPPRVAARSEPS